jgi:hypothetical protein
MGPMQGPAFAASFGRLIVSRVTDCRRMGFIAVEAPLGGILVEGAKYGGSSTRVENRRLWLAVRQ